MKRLFDMKGAAEYLGMSKGFVEKEAREGRLQVLHLGRVRRIDVKELDRYIEEKASVEIVGSVSTHHNVPDYGDRLYVPENIDGEF